MLFGAMLFRTLFSTNQVSAWLKNSSQPVIGANIIHGFVHKIWQWSCSFIFLMNEIHPHRRLFDDIIQTFLSTQFIISRRLGHMAQLLCPKTAFRGWGGRATVLMAIQHNKKVATTKVSHCLGYKMQ